MVRNFITLQVVVEFDQAVDPDAVRVLTRDGLEDVFGSPTWKNVRKNRNLPECQDVSVQLMET